MCRIRRSIFGVMLLAAAIAGCGSDTGAAPGSGFLNEGVANEFKSTDTSQFEKMKSQIQENMKNRSYTKKQFAPKEDEKKKAS